MLSDLTSPLAAPGSVLTDPPRVVELKREFYALDLQEESLKQEVGYDARELLDRVRRRKAAIAREVFQP